MTTNREATTPSVTDDATAAAAEKLIVEDIYCLTCGYNLRGLSGDPVRCPECGNENDLGTMQIPAAMIRRVLRNMETSPTACVLSSAILFLAGLAASTNRRPGLAVAELLALVGVGGWVLGCFRMRKVYHAQRGWMNILLDFHLAAAAALAPGYAMLVAATFARKPMLYVFIGLWVIIGGVVVYGLWTSVFGTRYSRARARIATMQRDAAVRIAHESLRKQLHRARRR